MVYWQNLGTYQPNRTLKSTIKTGVDGVTIRLSASAEYEPVLRDYCYLRPIYFFDSLSSSGTWIKYYPSQVPLVLPSFFDSKVPATDKSLQMVQRINQNTGSYIDPILWFLSFEILRVN
jgi:hypothetical protein